MVDIMKGGERAHAHSADWADLSIMMKYTPESGHCHSLCTLWLCCSTVIC
jgi:hypothetical protein